jgi:hypothetical protein
MPAKAVLINGLYQVQSKRRYRVDVWYLEAHDVPHGTPTVVIKVAGELQEYVPKFDIMEKRVGHQSRGTLRRSVSTYEH